MQLHEVQDLEAPRVEVSLCLMPTIQLAEYIGMTFTPWVTPTRRMQTRRTSPIPPRNTLSPRLGSNAGLMENPVTQCF
ncbi:hypothetical protein TNCV_2323401 [Trichonephila clavipes]|nr:hypothetical protein TNCV_2323401 [Trichonephila clavipes]